MKKRSLYVLLAGFPVTAVHGEWFLHRSTDANSLSNYTFLTPHLTNQRSAKLFVFPIQRPDAPKHLDRSPGLWFPVANQRWSDFYEFFSTGMGANLEFAVYRAGPEETAFRHQHTSAGNPFRRSYLDHPSLNNQPAAYPFITQNWDLAGSYNQVLRYYVAYDSSVNRWG